MRYAALALVAVLLLSGCDGSTGPEPFDPVGTLGFTYRGAISGTFSASGALELAADQSFSPVTGAGAYRQQEQLALVASRADAAQRADVFSVLVGDVRQTGTFAIDPVTCAAGSLAGCRVGFFVPEVDASELTRTPDLETIRARGYLMISGDVTITSITSARVKGTFRGVALRGNELSLQNTITISNGTFDLPLRLQ